MRSNKLLRMTNVFFNLPDNFTGDEFDAIEVLLKYMQNDLHSGKHSEIIGAEGRPATYEENYEHLFNTGDIKFTGNVAVSELVNNEWIKRDKIA